MELEVTKAHLCRYVRLKIVRARGRNGLSIDRLVLETGSDHKASLTTRWHERKAHEIVERALKRFIRAYGPPKWIIFSDNATYWDLCRLETLCVHQGITLIRENPHF